MENLLVVNRFIPKSATRLTAGLASTAIAIAANLCLQTTVQAASLTLGKLTFTEATSDVKILGGILGAGTKEDPIVLFQEITGSNIALKVEGIKDFGNSLGTNYSAELFFQTHLAGLFLKTVITNRTNVAWSSFEHELHNTLGQPSSIWDGISFANGIDILFVPQVCPPTPDCIMPPSGWVERKPLASVRPFTSDKFATVKDDWLNRDALMFSDSIAYGVKPGESVNFNYAITLHGDDAVSNTFYLSQSYEEASIPPEPVPEPISIFGILSQAVLGIGWLRKRQQQKAR
jgi:hypothetical protein